MPFNGSGTFTIVNTFVPNTTILSATVNQNFTDIATGLSDCLTRDGQAGMTADFKAIAGSIGSPGITFTSDATSGLYLPATGELGIVSKSLGLILNSEVYRVTAAAVVAGGSNYAVGDTIKLTGGTTYSSGSFDTQPVLTVATVSGTAVATVTVTYAGTYSVAPTNPVSQGSTSGSGTGATFNLTLNNPLAADYVQILTEQSNTGTTFVRAGASNYVAGLMVQPNALEFARQIGSTALTTIIGGTFLIPPQGILTTVSSTTAPIPATDQTAITKVYWTPYNGNVCPIYNGTQFVTTTSAQLSCDLTAGAQASGGIYDVYKFLNSGVVTLGFSPSWSAGTAGSVTAGSCARGTGAGGAALAILNGIYVNAAAMTLNNGATTYNISANQGTYLGSIYVNSTAGQINCRIGAGQSRVWGLWNAWNRRSLTLLASDPTASWTSATASWRQSRADATNFAMGFCGLPDEAIRAEFVQSVEVTYGNNSIVAQNGIGINSTTTPSNQTGELAASDNIAGTFTLRGGMTAQTVLAPTVGINQFNMLEEVPTGTTTFASYLGSSTKMILNLNWRG